MATLGKTADTPMAARRRGSSFAPRSFRAESGRRSHCAEGCAAPIWGAEIQAKVEHAAWNGGPVLGKKATEDFRDPRWSAPILGRFWRARQNARAPSVRAAFGRLQIGPTPPWGAWCAGGRLSRQSPRGAEKVPNLRRGSAAAKGNSAPSIPPPAEPRKPTPTDKRAKRGDSKRERFPDFHCPRGCQPARSGLTFGGKTWVERPTEDFRDPRRNAPISGAFYDPRQIAFAPSG